VRVVEITHVSGRDVDLSNFTGSRAEEYFFNAMRHGLSHYAGMQFPQYNLWDSMIEPDRIFRFVTLPSLLPSRPLYDGAIGGEYMDVKTYFGVREPYINMILEIERKPAQLCRWFYVVYRRKEAEGQQTGIVYILKCVRVD